MTENDNTKKEIKQIDSKLKKEAAKLRSSSCKELVREDTSGIISPARTGTNYRNSKADKNHSSNDLVQIGKVVFDYNIFALALENLPHKISEFNDYIKFCVNQKAEKEAKFESSLRDLKNWISNASVEDIRKLFEVLLFIIKGKMDAQYSIDIAECTKGLLNNKSYIFRDAYLRDIPSLLPIILEMGTIIDFSHLPYFAAHPEVPLFGSNIVNSKADAFTIPLEDEHIVTIVDTLLFYENSDLAGEWIHHIMTHDLVLQNRNPLSKSRNSLIRIITRNIITNYKYRDALKKFLLDNNVDEYIELISDSVRAKEQILQYERNEKEKSVSTTQLEETNAVLQFQNNNLQTKISVLLTEQRKLEVLSEQLLLLREKYDNQCAATEDVERAKQLSVTQAQNQIDELNEELDNLYSLKDTMQSRIAELTTYCENLTADLANARAQLEISKSESLNLKTSLNDEIVSDLIYALKDQINHLGKAIVYFSTKQEYDEATIEICIEAFSELLSGLKKIGATPIGRIGDITYFDPSLHHASEKITCNTRVKIVNLGWTVVHNVITKADVERIAEG